MHPPEKAGQPVSTTNYGRRTVSVFKLVCACDTKNTIPIFSAYSPVRYLLSLSRSFSIFGRLQSHCRVPLLPSLRLRANPVYLLRLSLLLKTIEKRVSKQTSIVFGVSSLSAVHKPTEQIIFAVLVVSLILLVASAVVCSTARTHVALPTSHLHVSTP